MMGDGGLTGRDFRGGGLTGTFIGDAGGAAGGAS